MASEEEFEEPVIMTFAFTPREWAHIAAILKFQTMLTEERAKVKEKPEDIARAMDSVTHLHDMIHAEMKRWAKS